MVMVSFTYTSALTVFSLHSLFSSITPLSQTFYCMHEKKTIPAKVSFPFFFDGTMCQETLNVTQLSHDYNAWSVYLSVHISCVGKCSLKV